MMWKDLKAISLMDRSSVGLKFPEPTAEVGDSDILLHFVMTVVPVLKNPNANDRTKPQAIIETLAFIEGPYLRGRHI